MGKDASPPSAPATPNYGQASSDAIYADLNTLPQRNAANTQSQIDAINTLGPVQRDYQIQSADAYTQAALDELNKYGSQFTQAQLKQLQEADPDGFALRQKLTQQALAGLAQGGGFDPGQKDLLDQNILAGQAQRGNIFGGSAIGQQALIEQQMSEALKQGRTANAQSVLGLAPVVTPTNPVAAGSAVPAYSMPTGLNPNPNAAAGGASFASALYGTQGNFNLQSTQLQQNAPNYWMQALGLLAGAGGQAGGALLRSQTGGLK